LGKKKLDCGRGRIPSARLNARRAGDIQWKHQASYSVAGGARPAGLLMWLDLGWLETLVQL